LIIDEYLSTKTKTKTKQRENIKISKYQKIKRSKRQNDEWRMENGEWRLKIED
jgi:hypothetical protein